MKTEGIRQTIVVDAVLAIAAKFNILYNGKKRLCLKTGESVLEFVFEKQSDAYGYWSSFGWCKDEWGEWEDVEYE